VVVCTKCNKPAVTFIRYNGTHLCHDHFVDYVRRRVKREVRKQLDLRPPEIVAVAVSGGKDSSVALVLLSEILGSREDVEVHAITVDEGIDGYRPPSLERAEQLTARIDVPHHVISFQDEFGETMDSISPHAGERTPCTYCGVLRRKCLNVKAREIGADVLATGLNLDDTVQSIMMNFTRGDVERLARMGPHVKVQPCLVPRIQPLRAIPEKETYLYAILEGIEFSDDSCPYSDPALRNDYREMVDSMEHRSPGSKFSILASYDTMAPMLRECFPPAHLKRCECGEPCLGERCKACSLLEDIRVHTNS
jgi:uncharacterized protein (TIGR00269 family)